MPGDVLYPVPARTSEVASGDRRSDSERFVRARRSQSDRLAQVSYLFIHFSSDILIATMALSSDTVISRHHSVIWYLGLGWRCLYAEIVHSRVEGMTLDLERALKRFVSMVAMPGAQRHGRRRYISFPRLRRARGQFTTELSPPLTLACSRPKLRASASEFPLAHFPPRLDT